MHTASCFSTTPDRCSWSFPSPLLISFPHGSCGYLDWPPFSRSVDPSQWVSDTGDTGYDKGSWDPCDHHTLEQVCPKTIKNIWQIIYFSFLEVHLGFLGLLSQAWWLKTTEMYSLTVLEVSVLKQRVNRAVLSLMPQERVPLCLF